MKIIGTVTATRADVGVVERSIPSLEVADDAHVFHIEDRAVEETFPEEKFQTGWTFVVWFTREPDGENVTPEFHRKPSWDLELNAKRAEKALPVRVTFIALVHRDSSDFDFGGVGDLQGTIGSRLESGKMDALGFRAVIVEDVQVSNSMTPDPMFTPEGGI